MGVSKPPKEGSKSFTFVENMKNVAADLFPAVGVNVQHKKINLADDFLTWEHERYSIRRLSALTVSHYKAPKSDYQRGTILDTKSSVDIPALARNVRILAESLASQLYNTSTVLRGRYGRFRGYAESVAGSADLTAAIFFLFRYQREAQSNRTRSAADYAEIFERRQSNPLDGGQKRSRIRILRSN